MALSSHQKYYMWILEFLGAPEKVRLATCLHFISNLDVHCVGRFKTNQTWDFFIWLFILRIKQKQTEGRHSIIGHVHKCRHLLHGHQWLSSQWGKNGVPSYRITKIPNQRLSANVFRAGALYEDSTLKFYSIVKQSRWSYMGQMQMVRKGVSTTFKKP